ncbi:MAG TPA: acyltransferase [Candidatus Acidoferrum sp.]|jgi:acetyltransferase-like isoleucine patch superfamily enzyme
MPLFNKLHSLGTIYYRLKGFLVYRLVFKRFGRGSYIRKPILILNPGDISVGERVSIRDGARLEVIRTNPNRIPQLIIENDTNIEQNAHIVCRSRIHIGSNVSITGNCSIVDVTHPFLDVHDPAKIGSRILDDDSFVEIGDGSFIGFGSVILPNVKIGKNVIIGANSVVTRDIPDYCVAAGAPASIRRKYDFATNLWVETLGEDSFLVIDKT